MVGQEKEVTKRKKEQVKELTALLKSKPVIGIVNISNLPSAQFQEIRKKMRGKAEVRVYPLNVISRTLESIGNDGMKKLEDSIDGPVGIILSEENPFKLFKFLKQNRSKTVIKAGAIAPCDIIVPAGPTDMPAGPALSELKIAGVNVKIDQGKIAIAKDSMIAKEGEEITPEKASALSKLGIKPLEIGLEINVLFENGVIYPKGVLDINEEEFMSKLGTACSYAFNLAVNTAYPAPGTIKFIIQKASSNARNLAINAGIITPETVKFLLSKANAQALGVKNILEGKGYS